MMYDWYIALLLAYITYFYNFFIGVALESKTLLIIFSYQRFNVMDIDSFFLSSTICHSYELLKHFDPIMPLLSKVCNRVIRVLIRIQGDCNRSTTQSNQQNKSYERDYQINDEDDGAEYYLK